MARLSASRLLVLGVVMTFLVTTFYGVIVLQGSSLSGVPLCDCAADRGAQPGDNEAQVEPDPPHYDSSTGGHSLCVLVPFRDRFEELLEFAPHLSHFLTNQSVQHKIVVINQVDRYRFNRASLINVGFLENRGSCDYIAMHDVDLLPLNPALSYGFPSSGPYHLAAPWLHPRYHYKSFVGGIMLMQSKHFEQLNGMSNKYWGWGREDDEFFVRLRKAKLDITRPGNFTTGTKKTFRHIHDKRKRKRDSKQFFDQWERTKRLDRETGLTTVQYDINSLTELSIQGTSVSVLNVNLECETDYTPWCLEATDHAAYQRKLEDRKQMAAEEDALSVKVTDLGKPPNN